MSREERERKRRDLKIRRDLRMRVFELRGVLRRLVDTGEVHTACVADVGYGADFRHALEEARAELRREI
jgi:hypothetical protein